MKYSKYAPAAVRVGLSIVFILFGLDQWIRPEYWLGYLPSWIAGFSDLALIYANGILDFVLGVLLLLGFLTRPAAIVATLHLFGIALTLGYNDVAIRDIGLAFAALSVALHGYDDWCLDARRATRA